jgi:hypothetical protein
MSGKTVSIKMSKSTMEVSQWRIGGRGGAYFTLKFN